MSGCGPNELERLLASSGRGQGGSPNAAGAKRDFVEAVLKREATEQDELLQAHRVVLARRDPMNCLEHLAALNKALLREVDRLAQSQAEWEAALIIGTRFLLRAKGQHFTPTDHVVQGARLGRARKALDQNLTWASGQRMILRDEAESIMERAAGAARARIMKMKRRLQNSRSKAEEAQLLVGGRTVPRLGGDPVFNDVKGSQLELVNNERLIKKMDDLVWKNFSEVCLFAAALSTACYPPRGCTPPPRGALLHCITTALPTLALDVGS